MFPHETMQTNSMDKTTLLTCIYDVQMYCFAVVVSAICYVLLRLKSLQIEGYPRPFSIGTGFYTLDQDSRSHISSKLLFRYVHTHTCLPCGRLPCLFYSYSGYGKGPLFCHGILTQGHEIPRCCWLYTVPQ